MKSHTDTQTHRIYSCKNRNRERISAGMKLCHGQFTRSGHSQTQMPELKRTTTLWKLLSRKKPKGTLKQIIYFLKTT